MKSFYRVTLSVPVGDKYLRHSVRWATLAATIEYCKDKKAKGCLDIRVFKCQELEWEKV